jgi:anti-anti-sigma regulatory factor
MATEKVILNCARITNPSVAVIDHIARLRLGVRRGGCELCLQEVGDELGKLIELAGLSEVLGVQVKGQAEERKELRGVEEEGELADPTA